jgi:hypothetical protein
VEPLSEEGKEKLKPEAAEFKEGAKPGRLWAGVLVGPLAMLTQLQANYSLVLWACKTGGTWSLHLVSLLALAATAAAGLVAWRDFRAAGAEWDDDGAGVMPRSRFMAAVGVMTSALFALVILAQWAAVFLYDPCQR